MTDIIQCPHCGSRIIPMAGSQCPSCQKNVLDLAEISKSDQMNKMYSIIGGGYKLGRPRREIVRSCKDAGFHEELIEETLAEYRKNEEARLFGLITIGFWSGIGLLLVGTVTTFVTLYFISITGIGFFAYGAMAIGLASIMTSIYMSQKMRKSLGR